MQTTPYRQSDIKAPQMEWYCTLSDNGAINSSAPVWATLLLAAFLAAFFFCVEPRLLLHWGWVRYLGLCAVYMIVWSALFMRRRPVQ